MVIYLGFQQTCLDIENIPTRKTISKNYLPNNQKGPSPYFAISCLFSKLCTLCRVIFNRCRIRELLNHFSTTTFKNIYQKFEIQFP